MDDPGDADADTDTGTGTGTDADADTDTDSDSDTDSGTGTDADTDADTDTDTDSDTDTDTDTGTGSCPDADGDGHDAEDCGGDDCNDTDPLVHPGAVETACDGMDQDCDLVDLMSDADGDGSFAASCGGDDCADDDATVHPGAPDASPQIETIADGTYGGPSVVLDASGAVHVAYFEGRYATNASDAWVDESFDDDSDLGACAIAIDAAGDVHIAYTRETRGLDPEVRHATNAGGAWVHERVTSGFGNLSLVAIAVDADATIQIAYRHGDLLRLATDEGAGWSVSTLDSRWTDGDSLLVEPDGTVHAVYESDALVGLRYGTNASGAWVSERLPWTGWLSSMTLDAGGAVHIGYNSGSAAGAYTNASGAWVLEATASCDTDPAIAIGADGSYHLACANTTFSDGDFHRRFIYYTDAGGADVSETVDANEECGWEATATMDASGNAMVVYTCSGLDLSALRVAVLSPPDGIDSDCDGMGW